MKRSSCLLCSLEGDVFDIGLHIFRSHKSFPSPEISCPCCSVGFGEEEFVKHYVKFHEAIDAEIHAMIIGVTP